MTPELIGAAAAATLAGFGAYHALAPRSQLYGQTFIGTPGVGKHLVLTYDDGPNDPHTLHLLDVLAKHQAKATFFLIGKHVRTRPAIVQRIAAEGHEIANHTYSHPSLAFCGHERIHHEISDCEAAVQDAGVKLTEVNGKKLFRPPFGARRPGALQIVRQMGYLPIMWSVWCFDWRQTTTAKIEQHAVKGIRGGDVILLHDGGHLAVGADRAHTVEATDRILRRYKQQGMDFVGLQQMVTGNARPTGSNASSKS
jgi:peptidoglycan/xylan/chitin deacetylase (PgdA/CDA1 family)